MRMLAGAALIFCLACSPSVVLISSAAGGTATVDAAAGTSTTITTTCDKNGNCQTGVAGASKAAHAQCTQASGNNPNTYPPACYFYCVPNCGTATLRQGQTGNTSSPGTITLVCNGQAPLVCALRIDVP